MTAKDIRLAVHEGMRSIEHVKRFTTTGMATDQGKTSNMHGLAIAAETLGKADPGGRAHDLPRALHAGDLRRHRQPLTRSAVRSDAQDGRSMPGPRRMARCSRMSDSGSAPGISRSAGEDMHAAVNRECVTVRKAAGLFDASTLGKIEVVGPDAAKFMELLYTNPWEKLEPGRCRYGIMLREDGFIYDDGVVGRLAPDRFHVTTTTGGAARVMNHMEDYLQTEFPPLNVWLTSISEQWAVIAVQGPKRAEIIAPLVEGIDISDEAMPHMSVREGRICGVPTRLFRMSFTGDRGFEVNVPADYGQAVWEALWAEGQKHGACAYGTEAMHVLRAEKGYIIVGQDTDGTVTPNDAGLDWAVGKKKTDFVGIRGMTRPDLVAKGRKQLVGLKTKDPQVVIEEGAQIVADPEQPIPMRMIGHVTSSYWSQNCGRSIALALLADGRGRMGETVYVPMAGRTIEVGSDGHGVLRREGGSPQWLSRHVGTRREPRACARRAQCRGIRSEHQRAGAGRTNCAARAGGIGRGLVQGARCCVASDAEDCRPVEKRTARQGRNAGSPLARAGRMADHRRGRPRSAGGLPGGQGAALRCRHLAPQCRHFGLRSRGRSHHKRGLPAGSVDRRFSRSERVRERSSARPRSCCGAPRKISSAWNAGALFPTMSSHSSRRRRAMPRRETLRSVVSNTPATMAPATMAIGETQGAGYFPSRGGLSHG